MSYYLLQRRKGKWIDGMLLTNCLLKHGMEEKIEVMERRGGTSKQLLGDLKGKSRYCKLKQEALVRTVGRTRLGRGYGPVVRQYIE
jgi:hypothetical protein